MSPQRARLLFRTAATAATLAALSLLIPACSGYQIRRAQHERRALGDLLYVESAGPAAAASTLVFLPGMMGTTTYWRKAGALALADPGTRVLLLDELGFGRSPWPPGEYTLDEHLAAVDRTLNARGVSGELTVIGHSFGAMLATEYSARHQQAVRQVILFGTPLYRGEAEARRGIGKMSALAGLTARSSKLARFVCALHTAFLPLTARLAPLMSGDVPPSVAADGALHFWPSLRGSVENIVLSHSIEPAVNLLGNRLTFVHGRRDRITPLARVREMAAASGAALVVTEDDHVSYWRTARHVLRESLPNHD
jgi:pimeloyl-ACP methyl ester carboxylesterase